MVTKNQKNFYNESLIAGVVNKIIALVVTILRGYFGYFDTVRLKRRDTYSYSI